MNAKFGQFVTPYRVALCACSILIAVCLAMLMPSLAQAKTYNQKGDALAAYKVKNYKVVKNKKYAAKPFSMSSRIKNPVDSAKAHTLGFSYGNLAATAKTYLYLPLSMNASGDLGNPQSAVLSADGRYAYVAYPKSSKSDQGRIIRYDLQTLQACGAMRGDLSEFNRAVRTKLRGSELTEVQKKMVSCIKVGPWFTLGHGSTLTMNPKTGELWFCSKTGKIKTNLQRINMSTLKPNLKYNFRLKSTVPMGNNLTFDKKGRCYFFSQSGGGWAPKGTIKIYRGTIGKKKVKFKLFMQGIRNWPSKGMQGMGYNPANNCLYMVGNGVVMRVPVSKLGKLKAADVKTTVFTGIREYEGISFTSNGQGYLLVNGYPELMATSAGF